MENVVKYTKISYCPLCAGEGQVVSTLSGDSYVFGSARIPYPAESPEGIPILKCEVCALVYKGYVPTPEDLKTVFETEATDVWITRCSDVIYAPVVQLVKQHFPSGQPLDVLDIGSSDGAFLKEIKCLTGRRSALDVTCNDACAEHLAGEFIDGFIESDISWSGNPYHVVTAFDVLEHLYQPQKALNNMGALTRDDGILVLETGDADSEKNLGGWWYLQLFEHHIAWTESALAYATNKAGLSIQRIGRAPHKSLTQYPLWKRATLLMLLWLSQRGVSRSWIKQRTRVDTTFLGNPFKRDHIRVVLVKNLALTQA